MHYRTLIDSRELADLLDERDLRIVDCRFDLADTGRGEAAFAQGHIPGACYAHLDRDLSDPVTADSGRHPLPDPARLRRWLGAHGIGNATQVVAYDDSGGTMAVRLWWLLRWLGHDRVALLDGGWQAWQAAGQTAQTGAAATVEPATFAGRPDSNQVVTTDELVEQANAGMPGLLLLDVRTAERFRGEAEPIDPVAGHIPGAVNLPLQDNLDTDGRFKSPQVLHTIYREILATHAPGQLVAMCGSGVTACHSLLALEIAGLGGGRLYAGSWSEWIRDPQRPVAVGG